MRRVVVTALFVAAILGGCLLGVFLAVESDLPQVTSLEDFQPNIITQVFAADGSVLGEFAIEKRVVIAFRDIPPVLRNAIVAVEDERFDNTQEGILRFDFTLVVDPGRPL